MPGWAWVFIVLHVIDFFFLVGGAIGGILQVFIVTAIAAVASNRKKSTGVRVLVCIGIWLLSTIAQFILAVGIASLMY